MRSLQAIGSTSARSLLQSSSSNTLRPGGKREEVRLFFDTLFVGLGAKLSHTENAVEKTLLTDFVYAKVRKLVL